MVAGWHEDCLFIFPLGRWQLGNLRDGRRWTESDKVGKTQMGKISDQSWSPDGSKIAFASARDGGLNTPEHIFVMNADGTERRNLTGDTDLTKNRSPAWSPDGRKIAFQSQHIFDPGLRYHIYVITAEGEELERLTEEGSNRMPAYSPDGAKDRLCVTP